LPPTANAKVDLTELQTQLQKGSQEMEDCVDKGKIMIFGYPLMCYSPNGGGPKKKEDFWKCLFHETMKVKDEDASNTIADIIDQIDETKQLHTKMYQNFSKGRYRIREKLDKLAMESGTFQYLKTTGDSSIDLSQIK
jgi:hypothetical protein